ncbi:MAG: hypothetical protein CMO80_08595 [Verrucomicrobiales bacterium]|nr:hypothetical protein [Verrucomicrobiales bacterium]
MNETPTICYSLADQSFAQTKSLGILNLSLGLLEALNARGVPLKVLGNETLRRALPNDVNTHEYNGAIGGKLGRVWWDQWKVYSAARRTKADWLFLPKGFTSFTREPPMRLAAYVHDTIQDFYRENHPNAVSDFEQWYFENGLKSTLSSADVIFTNSDFTADEVRRKAKTVSARTPKVIKAGIGFRKPGTNIEKEDRIVVLTGRFPHKLTAQAIEWMARWDQAGNWPVDWIGSLPEGVTLPDRRNWRMHSRLPESDYRQMVNGCRVLVFFSEYEGFGMPPVEAALAGVCPVFSAIPVTTEVMMGTGCPFRNDDFDSFAKAMEEAKLVSESAVDEWGERLLKKHDWGGVADRVIEGLGEIKTRSWDND